MITEKDGLFALSTGNTSYLFRVMETGHLEHLYYGRKIRPSAEVLAQKHAFAPGNTNVYDNEHRQFSLEDVCLEFSSLGKGDIREPFIEVIHADGSTTSDFLFEKFTVTAGKEEYDTLPGSYDEKGEAGQLCITLRDKQYGLVLELYYYVYEECDVITRRAVLCNESSETVRLERLMSLQLDFDTQDYVLTTFHGAWAREMQRVDTETMPGKYVSGSYTGTSSSRANPFCMLGRKHTTEDWGDCYGFNLIYSGNHYEAAEVSSFGKLRLVSGIQPQNFSWVLEPGERFEAPEAVMTYSKEGCNGMSGNMHRFVREHIVRGVWKKKLRPVLLNSWEACYFDISEQKLLRLAKAGKEAGIELFVMDDGWFGERDDDAHSLGDWQPNLKKLPGGISGLAEKIKALGLSFGIWVEPEMVNVSSRLYQEHPEWVIEIPGKPHSEGRNQRILDLTNEAVQNFIIEKMSDVFSSADISYVKWDMNRTFSDYFSGNLPPERQQETAHRYILGLYRCMRELTRRFPQILFEGCAAGGNRFDLGILCYFPQIWASDNTDAFCRAEIQNGYSYGYPLSVIGAHVSSCPNHQTLRMTPLETRFAVAAFGVLGYECNFCDMSKEELAAVKAQISIYREWRKVLLTGDFYRGRSFLEGNVTEWTCVSKDKKRAAGFLMQKLAVPNQPYGYYRAKGLDENMTYHFYNRILKYNIKDFGDLVNTVSPVHIRQDSLIQRLAAKFIHLDGETEDYTAGGDTLMYGGVRLRPAFAGTGYDSSVRCYPDFGSRLYFMEAVEEKKEGADLCPM